MICNINIATSLRQPLLKNFNIVFSSSISSDEEATIDEDFPANFASNAAMVSGPLLPYSGHNIIDGTSLSSSSTDSSGYSPGTQRTNYQRKTSDLNTSLDLLQKKKYHRRNNNFAPIIEKHPICLSTSVEAMPRSNGHLVKINISLQSSSSSEAVTKCLNAGTHEDVSIRSGPTKSSYEDTSPSIRSEDQQSDIELNGTKTESNTLEHRLRMQSFNFKPIPELPNPRLEMTWDSVFDKIRNFIAKNRGPNEYYYTHRKRRDLTPDEPGLGIGKLRTLLAKLDANDNS